MALYRSQIIAAPASVLKYCRAVGADFCPYLSASVRTGQLLLSEYDLDSGLLSELQRQLFAIGLVHTEILRQARRAQDNASVHSLQCENVILTIPEECLGIDGAQLFAWPHWFLKLLYTEVAVVFGKFWIGEHAQSRDGREIPTPPVHLLSIRSAIRPIDSRFFKKANALLPYLETAIDDNRNVLEAIGSADADCAADMTVHTNLLAQPGARILETVKLICQSRLFEDVQRWSAAREQELGSHQRGCPSGI